MPKQSLPSILLHTIPEDPSQRDDVKHIARRIFLAPLNPGKSFSFSTAQQTSPRRGIAIIVAIQAACDFQRCSVPTANASRQLALLGGCSKGGPCLHLSLADARARVRLHACKRKVYKFNTVVLRGSCALT